VVKSNPSNGWFSAMSAAFLDFEFGMVCLFLMKERLNSDEPSPLDNWIFNIYIMGEKEQRSTINSTTTSHLKSLNKTPSIGLWKTRSYSLLFQRVSNMKIYTQNLVQSRHHHPIINT
jgi:hypothetical protein